MEENCGRKLMLLLTLSVFQKELKQVLPAAAPKGHYACLLNEAVYSEVFWPQDALRPTCTLRSCSHDGFSAKMVGDAVMQ